MVPNGWLHKTVGDICHFVNGNGFKSSEWDTNGLPIIRIQNLNGSEDFNYFNGEIKEKWLVNTGDILFAWAGTKGVSFGAKRWLGPQGVLNQHIFRVEPLVDVDKEWLYLALLKVTQRVEEMAHGFKATLLHVQKADITDQVINIPPLPEQKKIAQILSTWGQAIATTERLLGLARQQKKALMQQLLTGKKRFGKANDLVRYKHTRYGLIPEDWAYPAIRDICKQVVIKNANQEEYPVLSCSKYDGFVDSLKYFNKKVYSDDTSGYRVIPRDCFGFPSNHIEEGSIGLQNLYDYGIVSPIYEVFRANKDLVNNQYLIALLKTEHYRQIFAAATNASVDRRGSLRWKEFASINVPLPPLEEQNKIAAILSTTNQETEALQSQLDGLKQEKKALMQALLTGKRRVNVMPEEIEG